MRDPLRNVSVRYKLVISFLGVCFLAFGVGGFLVSSSARESLEREILTLLRFQSQFYATVLEADLRALGLRARDFASDGYIRTRFDELGAEPDPVARAGEEEALRGHLLRNKLTLEPAFSNLALARPEGNGIFLADEQDALWIRSLTPAAFGTDDWSSGIVVGEGEDTRPSVVLATPLWSLAGDRRVGTLLVRVDCGVWIASALGSIQVGEEMRGADPSLRLRDRSGRALEIPQRMLGGGVATGGSGRGRGSVLVVTGGEAQRERVPVLSRDVLASSFPITINGWALETSLETTEALRAVSGLQARFLLTGVVLALAACVILFFPMRFLVRPIRELRDATVHIGEGDFSVRVPVDSTDEIGDLSQSFNRMARAVEERTESLEATAESLSQRKNDLLKERDRLNAVILSMRDGLMVLDADGRPDVWNAAAEPLRTAVADGGLGVASHRNCQRSALPDEEDPQPVTDAGHPCLKCLFEPAAPPRSCLLDVGPFVYEIHSTRLSSEPDGRAGRVLVARDVADRAQQDEREIHQERLAVLGEVAAVMAHELNNPLAAIKMFSQMIVSKLPADSPLLEDVKVIERNTQTCTRTIRELLDYATGATPEVGPVDIHESLREVASFLRAFRERKEIELELVLAAEDPVVTGDEVQLRQVFVNLILNALQAVGEGTVEVRTRQGGGHIVVEVEDDGPGIPPESVEEIFRPFYTTKPRGSGTGLGLSTARRITEIQGGGIELVESRPGKTVFLVRLLRDAP
ncbi:MAG: ATP-binding protein [Planctomycetota bacterium]|jgi:signal transduction histidine kinase|nr:ATP-binding protein [Planctomycetota bacterium]